MAWVYILECADKSLYVGSTIDLDRRVWQHNAGEGSAYTKRRGRRPVTLLWSFQSDSVEHAFRLEKQIQNWSRAKRFALIRGDFDLMPALAKKDFSRRHEDRR